MSSRVVSPAVTPAPAPHPARAVTVALRQLDPALGLPERARRGDAGVDLCAADDVVLQPGERALVGTGIALALPPGHVGLVHPRSGLAARSGLTVLNAPGTVDSGYRGEVQVCLVNLDPRVPVRVRRGDRIAQLLVQEVLDVDFDVVTELPVSQRGARGHGSSGGHASLLGSNGSGGG